jgi:Protein of unknown function (DUF2997)
MPQQTIRFCIRPNGVVEELVEGVQGNGCLQLTKLIEARLGSIQRCTSTSDHYLSASAELHQKQISNVSLQHD